MSATTTESVVTDSIIKLFKPNYPDWVQEVLHPEIETGPAEFDVAKVELWLAPGQADGVVQGHAVYEALKAEEALQSCLGLLELEAVRAKGLTFFRKYFGGKAVFGWRSVVQSRHGSLLVPYLLEDGGRVVVRWHWLGRSWNSSNPALRFSK